MLVLCSNLIKACSKDQTGAPARSSGEAEMHAANKPTSESLRLVSPARDLENFAGSHAGAWCQRDKGSVKCGMSRSRHFGHSPCTDVGEQNCGTSRARTIPLISDQTADMGIHPQTVHEHWSVHRREGAMTSQIVCFFFFALSVILRALPRRFTFVPERCCKGNVEHVV